MAGIVNLLANAFQAPSVRTSSPIINQPSNNNPYSNNPFVNYNGSRYNQFYAQNKPVKGGYFAGYYNGKQNIVGRKLFVEV